jgi:hypothetical protein
MGRGRRQAACRSLPTELCFQPGDLLTIDRDEQDHYVADLINEVLPPDTAFAVLSSDSFGKLVDAVAWAGRNDTRRMEGVLREVVVELEPSTLEWLAEGAESPVGYLISRVRRVGREQP